LILSERIQAGDKSRLLNLNRPNKLF